MSSFSYIAFPREIGDINGNHLDQSKYKTVKDVRGTLLEKQYDGNLTDLPGDANIYLGDIFADSKGISISDKDDATFSDVFLNEFIYGFAGDLKEFDEKWYQEIGVINQNEDDFMFKFIKRQRENPEICRRQLADLAAEHLKSGETIELYSEFVEGTNFNLGSPKRIIRIPVEEILTSKAFNIDDDNRVKFELYKE